MTDKNQYYQMLRGLCIIFVILIHTSFNSIAGHWVSDLNVGYYTIVRNGIGIAVPLFFAMSGYFTKYNKKNIFDKRLIIPFICWSILYGAVFMGSDIFSLKGILKTITGQNAIHLYFIFVLIQIRWLLPILNRYKNSIMHIAIISLTLIWYVFYYAIFIFEKVNWSLPWSLVDFFPAWILYWYIGYTVRENKILKYINRNVLTVLGVIALILTIIESYWLMGYNPDVSPVSQMRLSNLAYCIFICLLVFKCEKKFSKENILSYIGNYSYGIYYIHFFLIILLNKYCGFLEHYPHIIKQVFFLSVTLTGSILCLRGLQKILGKNIAFKLFGI